MVLITLFWGGFALLSGIDPDGGLPWWQNLTNAAPWVALAGVVWIAFKWPRIGGCLIILLGVASVIFFNAWTTPVVLFGIALPMLLAGGMLVLGGVLTVR
ncbi:hypothetical protein [Yoonia sp. R2-816]|uniref:DUF7670 domain-containing protein n=1 Tax=Yoonia sp. R2-816 TaxID=3342638 RepID=UPI00372D66A3